MSLDTVVRTITVVVSDGNRAATNTFSMSQHELDYLLRERHVKGLDLQDTADYVVDAINVDLDGWQANHA